MLIQEAWREVTANGEVTAEALMNGENKTLNANACRTSCGDRDCGIMDDYCGGKIACGSVVCREKQQCTRYGRCEDDLDLTLRRIDTHDIADDYDAENPTGASASLMMFEPVDPLYRGRFTYECKLVHGEHDTESFPENSVVFVNTGNDNGTVPTLGVEKEKTIHEIEGWSPCTSPHLLGTVPNGESTFYVRLKEAPSVTVNTTWKVDLLPPTVNITESPTPIVPIGTTVGFVANSTEPAYFLCDIDAGATSNPDKLFVDRPCFYEASGCNFEPCDPNNAGLTSQVAFSLANLTKGRHNVTIRVKDIAGNVAATKSWVFSLDDCIQENTCEPSSPHMATVRQCEDGFYLDLDDDNICRTCNHNLGCTPGSLHCTNEVDSVCGDCDSGFDPSTGENFYDCTHVERWPSY